MNTPQSGILAPVPPHSRYLEFSIVSDCDPVPALRDLASRPMDDELVIGLGLGLVQKMGKSIEGLRTFPGLSGPGCEVPSTQADIWCWLRGNDRGQITHAAREITRTLQPAFSRERMIDGFKYESGRDLTGYEDGTENPEDDAAYAAAIAEGLDPELDGSSFVAVQQWVHDLNHFEQILEGERDNIIGRRISDNEELDDAPVSAHVKRTAQESFDPEAFIVRRSMPWADASGEGLMFVAFGRSLDAFEAQLRRMTGQEDKIIDGLFRFTHPVSGSYFWCPPVGNGHLNLGAIGL